MLIKNTEALKSWLVVVLEPLCDADSSALARYVLALLKKDKPEKDLKRVMVEQLDVFLAEETTPFVERLFKAINTEEYLKGATAVAAVVSIVTAKTDASYSTATEITTNNTCTTTTSSTTSATNRINNNEIIIIDDSAYNTNENSVSNATKTEDNSVIRNSYHPNERLRSDNNGTEAASAPSGLVTHNNSGNESRNLPKTSGNIEDAAAGAANSVNTVSDRISSTASISHNSSMPPSSQQFYSEQQSQLLYNAYTPYHTHSQNHGRNESSTLGSGVGGVHHHHYQQQQHCSSPPPPAPRNISNIADKENQPRDSSRRRRTSQKSHSRSRSRSNERLSRRSRSRDRRINEREKAQRQFRNKSPTSGLNTSSGSNSSGPDTRYDRRRSGNGTSDRRRISANSAGNSISNKVSSGASAGNSAGGNRINRSPNSARSRSTSVERIATKSKRSPSAGRFNNATSSTSSNLTRFNDGENSQRCRDFDEKGYCVRGETCPWDHGINPVVFEDINNQALLNMSMREYNPDTPEIWSRPNPTSIADVLSTSNSTMIPAGTGGVGGGGVASNINSFSGGGRSGSGSLLGGALRYPPNATAAPVVSIASVVVGDKQVNGIGVGPVPVPGVVDYTRPVSTGIGSGFRPGNSPLIPYSFNTNIISNPPQRELIPVPVMDANRGLAMGGAVNSVAMQQNTNKRRYSEDPPVAIDAPTKRKASAHSRLGPRVAASMQNCSLELRKIPRGLNTISHLNNHFAKFGKIVNMQISYDGDPEAAIITFSTHAEANVAYRSTEAVLNNRFIKVFWHTSGEHNNNSNSNLSGDNSTKLNGGGNNHNNNSGVGSNGRKINSQYHLNNVIKSAAISASDAIKTNNNSGGNTSQKPATKVVTTTPTVDKSNSGTGTKQDSNTPSVTSNENNSSQSNILQSPSLRLKSNVVTRVGVLSVTRNNNGVASKAVAQLANGLRKRKQELLQSYVKQMKSALQLLERCETNDPQRNEAYKTVKQFQYNIDKLHNEIALEQEQVQAQIQQNLQQREIQQLQHQVNINALKKSKEQQKKELLDIELELFAQQQEGNDTSEIQKRLEDLQRIMGIISSHDMNTNNDGGGMGSNGISSARATSNHFKNIHSNNFGGNGVTINESNSGLNVSNSVPPILTVANATNRTGKSSGQFIMGGGVRKLRNLGSTKVDRRSKTIIVTGFCCEDADSILEHLKNFGKITKHDMDLNKPQLIISFGSRINAEQAIARGKLFKEKRLQIIWAPLVKVDSKIQTIAKNRVKLLKNTDELNKTVDLSGKGGEEESVAEVIVDSNAKEDNSGEDVSVKEGAEIGNGAVSVPSPIFAETNIDTIPKLRLEDEEEDDESEDRSWRR